MQILNAEQVRAWDEFTIAKEPVASVDLMERAASACYQWLAEKGYYGKKFSIFCGKGNNGGDGLALARLLSEAEHAVAVYILEFGHKGTDDFQVNLARLHETEVAVRFISSDELIPATDADDVIVDALYGSGLNRPLEGLSATMVETINRWGNRIISIDIPSGLFVDRSSLGNTIVRATHTLSFQCFKPAFLVAENAPFTGNVHILDIGLDPAFLQQLSNSYHFVDREVISRVFHRRDPFAHKGRFGHAAIIAGSKGFMGAAVLCVRACLRSGAGKVTAHVPGGGYTIMQMSVPEAMAKIEPGDDYIQHCSSLESYAALGIGPGLGTTLGAAFFNSIFDSFHKPVVLDADALNILSGERGLLSRVPAMSVLTPHPKEFERLFGKVNNDFERIELALTVAASHQIIIVLKGHYTVTVTPSGETWFNSTGNPGMAKGGSGDVLTGMITALLGQGYSPVEAAYLGVYLHGRAGDLAASFYSEEAMVAQDIIDYIGNAFLELY